MWVQWQQQSDSDLMQSDSEKTCMYGFVHISVFLLQIIHYLVQNNA
jgi:hypothetical protein